MYDRTEPEKTAERIGNAQIVFTNKVVISKEILDKCPNVRYIGVLATGYNVVDIEAAAQRNIPVCNVPGYGTEAVAQFTMAMLLEICNRVGLHSEAVHQGEWQKNGQWCFWKAPLMDLQGKTMGIIGLGSIGKATAKLAAAFGMNVMAYSPHASDSGRTVAQYVTLDELYADADIIALHCPLFPETKGIINRESIRKMKDGVIILNSARGPLIVEQDLAEALESGKVYAAAVDVVSAEPIADDNPLLQAPNCLITPHIAWASKDSRQRLMDITIENLKKYLDGNPQNQVNKRG